jgi:ribosome-associated translation inhibitor RaiA
VARVKAAMEGEDEAALDQAVKSLQDQAHKLSEKIYQQAGKAEEPAPKAKPRGKDDEPVDADYEVVN